MSTRDPRIDAYIARSADFARPILMHLRDVVHRACPDVEETMKWSMPHFTYRGMLAGMAAFKAHATFGFWRGGEILGANGKSVDAMGQFGRITSIADLPPDDVLAGYVRAAMRLNETGPKKRAAPKKAAKPAPEVPDDLAAALADNAPARETFERFSPSHRREYMEWITEAKRPETRTKRVATALEWLAEGKARNWKYERG